MTTSSLDPQDWAELRALGHRVLDDMFDYVSRVRETPVWQPIPDHVRQAFQSPLPRAPSEPAEVYDAVRHLVVPYVTGNVHPGFMGWVHGGGNPIGMLAELIAAGLNANLGGRDHAPIEMERQVIRWAAEIAGMPAASSGVMVTGTSMANLLAVLIAHRAAFGTEIRHHGVGGQRVTAYAAQTAHGCIARAMDVAGLGTDALRLVGCDADHRIDLAQLASAIAQDRAAGAHPFMVIGTAGTVDVGAVDDLTGLADLCQAERLWFHVDGAFGALAMLSPRRRSLLAGLERVDSLAFDFHKWAQVPYDAGCILVRDARLHAAAFAQTLAYLRREDRGLAGGHPWPCDLGLDLSRGFRALKVWMTLQAYGADRLGQIVDAGCEVAQHLAARIRREPALELLAPVALNIVCFRVRAGMDADRQNREIVADLQESGVAAPSTTIIHGKVAIRAAIVNHSHRHCGCGCDGRRGAAFREPAAGPAAGLAGQRREQARKVTGERLALLPQVRDGRHLPIPPLGEWTHGEDLPRHGARCLAHRAMPRHIQPQPHQVRPGEAGIQQRPQERVCCACEIGRWAGAVDDPRRDDAIIPPAISGRPPERHFDLPGVGEPIRLDAAPANADLR